MEERPPRTRRGILQKPLHEIENLDTLFKGVANQHQEILNQTRSQNLNSDDGPQYLEDLLKIQDNSDQTRDSS